MTLTTIFFNIAISISLFFALCFIVLYDDLSSCE